MKFSFRNQSVRDLIQYNRALLVCVVALAFAAVLLSIRVFFLQERWVIIPTHKPENTIPISSTGYTEPYLTEWALYLSQSLMTTSYETVERQIQDFLRFAYKGKRFVKFCEEHAQFVLGSRIEMVFFPKKVVVDEKSRSVRVKGTFRYWMGNSGKSVSQEKVYCLRYKQGVRDCIFLTEFEEVHDA